MNNIFRNEKYMLDKKAIEDFVAGVLENTDMFLVDVSVTKDNKVTVEVDGENSVSIDDCVKITRMIEGEFDRDVEDYELEVGSAGLTSPFKVRGQYVKNIGNDVEVLTFDGKKLKGILAAVNDEDFVITISKKVKPEGAKRPVMVEEDITLKYSETKYTKYLIQFK